MNTIIQATPPPEERMMLSSLADFWSLLEPLLTAARARKICEIGLGKGEFTKSLVEFCKINSGHYTGIDPSIDAAWLPANASAPVEIIKRPSLEVLPALAAQDVYFLDGDHNYHTVRNELRLILEPAGRWPLVVLHDVCWPWGRRDQYCKPDTIPETERHSHSANLGAVPGRTELVAGGFSGEMSDYGYFAANHEGGPRNGVLTAVEDFLGGPAGGEWRLLVVPVVFGLGILYAPEKSSGETRRILEQWEKSVAPLKPLLEMMERNRVDLVLAFSRHVNALEDAHLEYQKLHGAYDQLAAHARELLDKYGELLAHTHSLQAAYDQLLPRLSAKSRV
jgi:hypothetical protein